MATKCTFIPFLQVGVIVVDVFPRLPPEIGRRVIPVCQTSKDALANFLDSSSSGGQIANYSRAFSDAFSLFTNDTNSGRFRCHLLIVASVLIAMGQVGFGQRGGVASFPDFILGGRGGGGLPRSQTSYIATC